MILGATLAVAGASAFAALSLERRAARGRSRRGDGRLARALRRGIGLGALVAALALLRAVDGLTLVTGGFVVAGFALAELVLSARPASGSG